MIQHANNREESYPLLESSEDHPESPEQMQENTIQESSNIPISSSAVPTEVPQTILNQRSNQSKSPLPDRSVAISPVYDRSSSPPRNPRSPRTSPPRTTSPRLQATGGLNKRSSANSPAQKPIKNSVRSPSSSPAQSPIRTPVTSLASSPIRSPVSSPIRTPSSCQSNNSSSSPTNPPRNPVESCIDSPWESPPRSPWESLPASPWESAPGSPWESEPGSPWESPPRIHWDDSSSVLEESDESDRETLKATLASSATSRSSTSTRGTDCLIFESWKSIGIQVQTTNEPIHMKGRNCRGIIVADRDSDSDDDYEPGTNICVKFLLPPSHCHAF